MEAGHADSTERRVIRIMYTERTPKRGKKKQRKKRKENEVSNPSGLYVRFTSSLLLASANKPPHKVLGGEFKGEEVATEIGIYMPKRGRRDPHSVAMVALAAEAAVAPHIEEDTKLLDFESTYFLANHLAAKFAEESWRTYEDPDGTLGAAYMELREFRQAGSPPETVPNDKLFIAKYKDPKLDATYRSFVKRKETAIKRETTAIEGLESEINKLRGRLKNAKKRKKLAEKALRDAASRRS
jgi:hypothetical protein